MTKAISIKNASHFSWGDACDGWWLKETGDFTVIFETMPPNTTEINHLHQTSSQFFYCLKGELTIIFNEEEVTLIENEGYEIAPGQAHKVMNQSEDLVSFLVISSKNAQNDRVNLE